MLRRLGRRLSSTVADSRPPVILIVSIGNPPKYDGTRHSVGHYLVDEYCKNNGYDDDRSGGYTFKVKPASNLVFYHNKGYMNTSGEKLAGTWSHFMKKATLQDMNPAMVVVSDELDASLGKVKVRKQGASARGHNGLKSIQRCIGKGFTGITIGIGRPDSRDSDEVADYVLGKFNKSERQVLDGQVMDKFSSILDEMKEGAYIYD